VEPQEVMNEVAILWHRMLEEDGNVCVRVIIEIYMQWKQALVDAGFVVDKKPMFILPAPPIQKRNTSPGNRSGNV
jgi:hypothetical protein